MSIRSVFVLLLAEDILASNFVKDAPLTSVMEIRALSPLILPHNYNYNYEN